MEKIIECKICQKAQVIVTSEKDTDACIYEEQVCVECCQNNHNCRFCEIIVNVYKNEVVT